MTLRVRVENDQENDLLQGILFVLGYKWKINGKRLKDFNPSVKVHQIGIDTGWILRIWKAERDFNIPILSFDDFINYVERNDIRYGR